MMRRGSVPKVFLLFSAWALLEGVVLPLAVARRWGYSAACIPLATGWALAVLNALAATWFARRALGHTMYVWAVWGLFANAVRVGLLVVVLAVVARFWQAGFNPLATSLICGYFAWLPVEIRTWRMWGNKV
ncbi:MAG: hypothetical protein ACOYOU_14125 [Kiritimatiellia bacterium]